MNLIDLVILVILGASVAYSLYRGFLHTLLSVGCCVLSVLLAFSFAPRLSAIVSGSEGITAEMATYTDAITRVQDYDLANMPVDQLNDELIARVLAKTSLPAPIATILESNLRGRVFASAGLVRVNDYVSNTVVAVTINVLCFLAAFVVIYLILSVLVSLIQHVFQFPLLKQLDWLAAGAFGLARGALLVYVVFLLLPILSTVIRLEAFDELLAQSTFASIFQSNGFFASVIVGRL